MAKVVTIINFKGGVGKTTVSVELSTSLARFYGKRTLLVDLDPQASATFYVMEQSRWAEWKNTNGSTADLFEQPRRFSIHKAIVQDVLKERGPVFGFDVFNHQDLASLQMLSGLTYGQPFAPHQPFRRKASGTGNSVGYTPYFLPALFR